MISVLLASLGSPSGELPGVIILLLPLIIYIVVSKKKGEKIDAWAIIPCFQLVRPSLLVDCKTL